VVLVVAIAAIGMILVPRTGSVPKTTFKTARVEPGDVGSSISATGVIQPLTTVEINSNVGGRLDRLPIELGQQVKKNQLIAEIDPTDPETQLDQAMARSDAATARWRQAQLNLDLQRKQSASEIARAQGARAGAQARMLQCPGAKGCPTRSDARRHCPGGGQPTIGPGEPARARDCHGPPGQGRGTGE
jgi:multidrug efflux pump subunit AcrA (membrane-fusion protein)